MLYRYTSENDGFSEILTAKMHPTPFALPFADIVLRNQFENL